MGLDFTEPTCHGKATDGGEADVTDVLELDSQVSDLYYGGPIEVVGAMCPTVFRRFWPLITVRIRQDWGEEQDSNPADWLELFYDLFFAAMSVSLSGLLSHSDLSFGVWRMAFLFALCFLTSWNHICVLRSLFVVKGNTFYFVMLVNMVGLAGSAADMDADLAYRSSFTYWRLVTYFSELFFAIVIYAQVPKARGELMMLCPSSIVFPVTMHFVILALPSGGSDEMYYSSVAEGLLWASVTLDLFISNSLFLFPDLIKYVKPIPRNIHHSSERYMLIMMILLGESVIAVGMKIQGNHDKDLRYCGVLCVMISFCIAYLYFNSQPHELEKHALHMSQVRAFFFKVTVQLLSVFTLLYGCAVKCILQTPNFTGSSSSLSTSSSSSSSSSSRLLAASASGATVYPSRRATLRGFSICFTICSVLIKICHKTHQDVSYDCALFLMEVCRFAEVCLGLIALGFDEVVPVITTVAAAALAALITEMAGNLFTKHGKTEHHDHSHKQVVLVKALFYEGTEGDDEDEIRCEITGEPDVEMNESIDVLKHRVRVLEKEVRMAKIERMITEIRPIKKNNTPTKTFLVGRSSQRDPLFTGGKSSMAMVAEKAQNEQMSRQRTI